MYYGIVAFPTKKVQDIANSYRKRYDPHYSLIPPHITLKERFQIEDDQIESYVKQLDNIAAKTAPIQVTLSKVSHFLPTNPTLYLVMDQVDDLTTLHNQLSASDDKQSISYDYIPHLTIGQRMIEGELLDVYSNLRLKKFTLQSNIDRFHLMYQLENGSWTIYQTFLLEGNQ